MKIAIEIRGAEPWECLAYRDGQRWDDQVVGYDLSLAHVAGVSAVLTISYEQWSNFHLRYQQRYIRGVLSAFRITPDGGAYFEADTDEEIAANDPLPGGPRAGI